MGIEVGGILGLVILILNIWAIVKTIQSSLPNNMKILWVLVIILLPVIGFILWLLIARVR